jgi:hypothetical protein
MTSTTDITATRSLVLLAIRFWEGVEAPDHYDVALLFELLATRNEEGLKVYLEEMLAKQDR